MIGAAVLALYPGIPARFELFRQPVNKSCRVPAPLRKRLYAVYLYFFAAHHPESRVERVEPNVSLFTRVKCRVRKTAQLADCTLVAFFTNRHFFLTLHFEKESEY